MSLFVYVRDQRIHVRGVGVQVVFNAATIKGAAHGLPGLNQLIFFVCVLVVILILMEER